MCSKSVSPGPEGDDSADRVIRRHADRHTVTRHYLDPKAPHPAAQLREDLVARIALHAIKAAGMHRDDSALHVDKIVFAQQLILSP